MQHVRTAANTHIGSAAQADALAVNRVLRNTYLLLGITLAFSAITAAGAMTLNLSHGAGLMMTLAAIGLVWFVLPRTAESAAGIGVVFAFTGLIGAGLGPIINHYLATTNGTNVVFQALGGTAFTFLGLSAYALISRKDFSFMRGFIAMGMMIMIGSMILLIGASLFGYHMPVLSLAFSAGIVLLMSAVILFQTSAIINGGERNYLMATTSLYLAIINIFTSLLHILGASND